MYQRIRSQPSVCQTHYQANLIFLMTANIKTKDVIKVKNIGSKQNRTHQTHHQATLILPKKSDYKSKRINKKINYRKKKRGAIKLCAKLTKTFLTITHKSKTLKFKLNEDPLQRQIYFLPLYNYWRLYFHSKRKLVEYL